MPHEVKAIEGKSDEQLVKEFIQEDSESKRTLVFETLISRYSEKAYSLASRMCRNTEDAEEVLQDVFVTVFRKLDNFEGKSSFSSWLYRVTVNAALMKLRKRRQDKSMPFEAAYPDGEDTQILQTEDQHLSDAIALRAQVSLVLQSAVSKLPDEYRAVFMLRDVDGLTSQEVGKILGISIPAVKSRLHRSRIMLRRKLHNFYQEFSSESYPDELRKVKSAA
jgi:RNA polymerase sigma-70 factor (ECF subfamily)